MDPTRTVVKDGKPDIQPAWNPIFLEELDGVFLVTAESYQAVQARAALISFILGDSATLISEAAGFVRPKEGPGGIKLRGKEHFGYQDGISEPNIPGFHPIPKTKEIQSNLNIIVLSAVEEDGKKKIKHPNPSLPEEPKWAENGAYLVFRKLRQKGMHVLILFTGFYSRNQFPSFISLLMRGVEN